MICVLNLVCYFLEWIKIVNVKYIMVVLYCLVLNSILGVYVCLMFWIKFWF